MSPCKTLWLRKKEVLTTSIVSGVRTLFLRPGGFFFNVKDSQPRLLLRELKEPYHGAQVQSEVGTLFW
ncbi:hypothetical protein C0J52_17457 [Blattella germanica]|nr:hypothetical protein C0J52_17457 [Blattella germanica]